MGRGTSKAAGTDNKAANGGNTVIGAGKRAVESAGGAFVERVEMGSLGKYDTYEFEGKLTQTQISDNIQQALKKDGYKVEVRAKNNLTGWGHNGNVNIKMTFGKVSKGKRQVAVKVSQIY